ncbi:MAG: indolepyruvate ferredoxin oxidoreductase family protein [Pseudomonadota bacterium]
MLQKVSLDDKYQLDQGRVFISGTQALVRLPMMQRRLDIKNGLNTAGFISGYRGSPLGNYDAALWRAKSILKDEHIHFLPGVNEDLAATSCWGTQQTTLFPGARYDGVFSIWYGKGPGVDRSGDPFKHGNLAGTSRHGGVLVLAGDDHVAKSSTVAFQSEPTLMASSIPVFNPADVQDYLDFGLHAIALSRTAGIWVGFKCVTETIETTYSAYVGWDRFSSTTPEELRDAPDLSIKKQFSPVRDEQTLVRYRLPMAQSYVRANGLDKVVYDSPRRTLGIVTSGKSYGDVRQALSDLGIDEEMMSALGVRLYKIAMTWPLEPQGLRHFAAGHQEILVVEEKRAIIQEQAATILYHLPADQRPDLSGKQAPDGMPLASSDGELSPEKIAGILAQRLSALGLLNEIAEKRSRDIAARVAESAQRAQEIVTVRTPAFCSGCPHNTSTRVPEGSVALAGIGCHTMAMWMPDRPTAPPTQMGGEGANWIGMAPFTEMQHVFQNMGDGTYFHSGLLAIRAAISSGANVTYKILHNHVVAMTGGQQIDGHLTVTEIARQVMAEGARRVVLVSDDPDKHRYSNELPSSVTIHHRDELIAVETELRDIEGVSVLIYDQGCATDKRRRRKRGTYPDPAKRYFINTEVCEGCGDCSKKSTCVSVTPTETPFGRKRRIDQSSCNKDYSCVKGFCPSFVTVTGGSMRKRAPSADVAMDAPPPTPVIPTLDTPTSMLVAGIGGTGVVTIGAVLGMAAHLEGKGCLLLDITGLAQKNGAVLSHIHFADKPEDLSSARIGSGKCDVLLACDLIVGVGPEAIGTLSDTRTQAIANMRMTATAQFQFEPDFDFQSRRFRDRLENAIGEENASYIDASVAAERLLGDSIGANMFLVGYAYQKGLIPISEEAILKAVELNGVAIKLNTQAFQYGRSAAHEGDAFWDRLGGAPVEGPQIPTSIDELVEHRYSNLIDYQNQSYANRYRAFIDRVREADERSGAGDREFTATVARGLYKLMAYKDEYEVARLHSSEKFRRQLEQEFEGDYTISFNLAPPMISKRDEVTGEPKKMEFGPWMMTGFRALAALKGLRGTPFDIFGLTEERRMERRLIADYRSWVETAMRDLSSETYETAVAIAALPDDIRGYGHVKENNVKLVEARRRELMGDPEAASQDESSGARSEMVDA